MLQHCLVCALAIPFCLPQMHARHFYMADVIAIVYAFRSPRWFAVAIVMQLISPLIGARFAYSTPRPAGQTQPMTLRPNQAG